MEETRESRRYLEGALPNICMRCYRRLVLFLYCFFELLLILFIYTAVLLDHWTAADGLEAAPWVFWTSLLSPAFVFILYAYMVSRKWFPTKWRIIGWFSSILYHTLLLFVMVKQVAVIEENPDKHEVIFLVLMVSCPAAVLLLSIQAYYLTVPREGDVVHKK